MKEKQFIMGPIQTRWVAALKKYPNRQYKGGLGEKLANGEIKACCLGQAGLIARTCKFVGRLLVEKVGKDGGVLERSFPKIGLLSSVGNIRGENQSLANLNDDEHHTWYEIACLIEAAPELFFTKPV